MSDDRYGGQVPPPPPSAPPVPAVQGPAVQGPAVQGPVAPEPWQAQPTPAAQVTRQLAGQPVPRWIIAAVIATVVGSVAAFTLGLMWPFARGHVPAGPLDFHGFAHVGLVTYDQPSRTALTTVQGDLAYLGWEQDGNLRVVSVDMRTGQERWRTTVTGAPRWGRLIASAEVLLVVAHEADASAPRKLFARDPATGGERWEISVRGEDRLFFTDRMLGWLDHDGEALHGIDLITGDRRWQQQFEGAARIVRVTTPVMLAQPTDRTGQAQPIGDDHRLVLITADRSVKVIDGNDGRVLSQRTNVAHPRDLVLAYEGRLYVVPEAIGYRVDSYNLADLAEPPRAIYSPDDLDRFPESLEPCGDGRVCVMDVRSLDNGSTEVAAINVADGSEAWRQGVPDAQWLLPVGNWLAVTTSVGFEPHVVVLDSGGAQRLSRPGSAARLNDGNLVVADPQLREAIGFAIGEGEATALGQLRDVAADDCVWGERHIICVGRNAAQIWRFAESR